MGGLALAGLVYSARRGESLPALLFVFATLLTPILIRDYDFPMRTRYAAIVFPALYLGLGAAVSMLVCDLKTRSLAAQIVVACMLLAALGLAAVVPLVRLGQYYDGQVAVGRTNEALLRVLAYSREAHLPVVLDGKILSTNTVNGNPSNVLEALFQWQNIEVHRLDSVEGLGQYLHAQATPVLVIVSDAHLAQLGMGDRLFPEPGGMVSAINDVEGYGLYRSVPAY
jgi:hypothetical protein